MVNHSPVGSFTHRVVHRRHRHRLRCAPVRCGEGERGLVEADLAVRVVKRDDNIGGRGCVQDNGIVVGCAAFHDCGSPFRLIDSDTGWSYIQEKKRIGSVVANKGIKIAIGININERRAGMRTHIAQAKWIRCCY